MHWIHFTGGLAVNKYVAVTKQAQCKFLDKLLKLPKAPQINRSRFPCSLVQHHGLCPALELPGAGLEREALSEVCARLQRQTEGRVPVFSHEVVPDHLRTKPDPEVEEQEKQLITDAARISPDAAQVGKEGFDTSASYL